MINCIVSFDWLQIYCDIADATFPREFKLNKLEYGSKHFASITEIRLYDELIAVMESDPRSKVLKPHCAIIKFANRLLYMPYRNQYIKHFLLSCKIKFISITRMDIAIDFLKFKNGLLPQTLINNFLSEKFVKNGRGKFTVIGEIENVKEVEYLRFGSKKSDVQVYLYNKSKEMREKVYKPYIAENFKRLGKKEEEDVWRLEFALKAGACKFLDESTGEYFKLDLSILDNDELLLDIVKELSNKYFKFKINDGQKNKTRMKDVDLLDIDKGNLRRIKITESNDVLKKDKVMIKNLHILDKEFENVDEETINAAQKVIEFLTQDDYLRKYYMKHVDEWNEVQGRN